MFSKFRFIYRVSGDDRVPLFHHAFAVKSPPGGRKSCFFFREIKFYRQVNFTNVTVSCWLHVTLGGRKDRGHVVGIAYISGERKGAKTFLPLPHFLFNVNNNCFWVPTYPQAVGLPYKNRSDWYCIYYKMTAER